MKTPYKKKKNNVKCKGQQDLTPLIIISYHHIINNIVFHCIDKNFA